MQTSLQPENHKHYRGLDGLRGLAVLMVLFQHYIAVPPSAVWGWMGVRIFFALSGFLITGILYDTRKAAHRWRVFYMRRALRIFPLYYGVLALAALAYPVAHWTLHRSYWLWPLYLQNFARFLWPANEVMTGHLDHLYSARFLHPLLRLRFGHFWSLAVEEQFYLIWPLVVFAVQRRETLIKICIGVILVTPLLRLVCALQLPEVWLSFGFEERFTFVQFDALLLGALAALWLRGPHPDLTRVAAWLFRALTLVFLFSEVICLAFYKRPLNPAIGHPAFASLGLSCADLFGVSLVLLAIDQRTLFSRCMENVMLRQLGKVSYGFYVFHDLFHDFYAELLERFHVPDYRGIASCLLALVFTWGLATLSFYAYERPFLQLKRYFVTP